MFIGTYNNSIDAKNRMIVPAKFREELGYKVVFMEKLAKLPISDPKARNFARNFTGNAEECEVDRQGRITLPQNLREQTGMVKELTTIGCMNKIEIWSREEYEGAGDQVQMDRGEIAKGMVEYGI